MTSVANPQGAAFRQWRTGGEQDRRRVDAGHPALALRTVQDLSTGCEPQPSGRPCLCAVPYVGCHEHGPQPRERSVACVHCSDITWSLDAVCDRCHLGWTIQSERQVRRDHRGGRVWSAKAS